MKIEIKVTRELFRFESHKEWVDWAQRRYRNCGVPARNCIAVDMDGNICTIGLHWAFAQAEGLYPVKVYEVAS